MSPRAARTAPPRCPPLFCPVVDCAAARVWTRRSVGRPPPQAVPEAEHQHRQTRAPGGDALLPPAIVHSAGVIWQAEIRVPGLEYPTSALVRQHIPPWGYLSNRTWVLPLSSRIVAAPAPLYAKRPAVSGGREASLLSRVWANPGPRKVQNCKTLWWTKRQTRPGRRGPRCGRAVAARGQPPECCIKSFASPVADRQPCRKFQPFSSTGSATSYIRSGVWRWRMALTLDREKGSRRCALLPRPTPGCGSTPGSPCPWIPSAIPLRSRSRRAP